MDKYKKNIFVVLLYFRIFKVNFQPLLFKIISEFRFLFYSQKMKIKKIEIEGFKSYSQKEVVDVLDTQFNAITGLNGSGKSNILDAICFLLGITNLSNVRAHSFADLVFKQGQAGINRATVTITFDNNVPPEQQPSGYNKFREIVVKRQVILNGRNTYHINGVTATNQRVSDLFRMVGINVNNPHFLIMQGRITKVLNMKPLEILSMVEEAAGVRMYECKKQSAIKTIEKKEVKLSEISRLLGEEILPSVEKLKNERENYLEYQRIERELEMFERKLHAYDYFNSHLQVRELAKKADSIKEEIRRMKREYEELEEKVKVEQANLHEMETAKAQEIGPEAKNLEKELKELQKELAKIESEKDGKEASLAELQTAIDRKNKSLKNDQLEMDKKRKQLAQTESDCGNEEQIGKNAEESVVRARQKLEALARGMTTDEEGNAVTLEAQLTATRSKLAERQTNVKKAQMRLEQFTATVGKKKAELHKIARRSIGEEGEKNRLEDEIKGIEHDLQQLNFDPVLEKSLEDERRQLTKESDQLKHQINSIEKDYYNLQFNYENPFNGFDRSKVKERVVRNFKLKDPKFATALEVIGGGRIYNVVVDKAETAKELLAKRCLKNRETFLPMDRIDGHSAINRRQIEEAKKLVGEENVYVPSQLVECAPEMRKIIDFVFGGALICETSEQANVLAYKNTQACRAVSVAGDDFKPSGVLTGGSRPVKVSVLKALYELSGKRDRIVEIEQRLDAVKFETATLRQLRVRYDEFNNKLVERQKQLDFIKEKLKMSPVEMIRAEIELLEREIADANKIIQTDQPEIEILSKRVKALEVQKKDENYQENEKKKAQKELTAAQKELDKLKSTFANAKEVLASLREEITSLKNSIRDDEEELETMSRLKEEKQTDIDQFNANVQEANEKVNRSQQKMDKFNKEIRQKDKAIRAKMADIEDLKKKMRQLENKQQSKEKDVQESGKTSNEFAKRAQQLEKAHRWISEEKDRFGERDGIYDFQNYNFEVGKREVETRRDRSKELQQTVNTKALKLLDTAELQCQQLEIKHAQLEKDKQRLYDAIEQLNEKKRRELIAAHKQISGDFCGIYSTLLPGASAELLPPNGAENCLAGLEVRVAFNGKYKDSLSELSGGQRSLVALSLILAMLKFKPAPFYILDEIDAALDMSHTENIGKMIKNHFSQSQFIVVSLKQGFFDNANVVYRVQFKDGRSTISRTENKH